MLNDMEKYAFDNQIPIIEKESLEFLTSFIKEKNITSILEIGSAIGYSAIMMALINPEIKIDTIERDIARYQIALNNIEMFNLNDQINIINDDALTCEIPNNEYDLIFIDAAKAQYQRFFERYLPTLKNDGYVLVDNLNFHGFVDGSNVTNNRNTKQLVRKIQRFKDWILNQSDFIVQEYHIGDGLYLIQRRMDNE